MLDAGHFYEMLLRTITGWFAFVALMFFIHDRRSYAFRTPGAIGVQTLAFGLFWYSTISMLSTMALLAKKYGLVSYWFTPSFVTSNVWFFMVLGDIIVNLSIGSIALACRLNVSTKKGRRYLRGELE